MRTYTLLIITVLSIIKSSCAFAQPGSKPLTKRVMLKTNVLSFIAQRPTFSVEKALSKTISAEVSFVQGTFNRVLFTDHYDYNGFLLRTKKYLVPLKARSVNPYAAMYIGTLRRHIQTKGWTNSNGYFGYPSRNFSSNSVRGGGSVGVCFFSNSHIVIDHQVSVGYGRYLKLNKQDPNTYAAGYPDVQVWLSIGYCF